MSQLASLCVFIISSTDYLAIKREEFLLLADGSWAQLSGESYEYDSERRVSKTTRANGRSSRSQYHDTLDTRDGYTQNTTVAINPNGTTLISSYNLDGSIAMSSGTGQMERHSIQQVTKCGIMTRQFARIKGQLIEQSRELSN